MARQLRQMRVAADFFLRCDRDLTSGVSGDAQVPGAACTQCDLRWCVLLVLYEHLTAYVQFHFVIIILHYEEVSYLIVDYIWTLPNNIAIIPI